MFYFTNFYGSKNSLLYHFFLAAYKISLNRTNITIEDNIPVHLIHDKKWIIKINDFFAPFYNFVKTGYKQNIASQISSVDNPDLKINTWVELKLPGINKSYMQSVININQDGISGFEIVYGKTTISAQKVSL
jgi:hypothetical protein